MDPLWKVISSKPITDEQAAAFLRNFVQQQSSQGTGDEQGQKNVSKDIRKLQKAVESMATRKKENES